MDCAIRETYSQEFLELEELNRKVSTRLQEAALRRWELRVMREARWENAQRQWCREWRQIKRITKLVAVMAVVHIGRVTGCIDPGFALLVQICLMAGCFLFAGKFFEIRRKYAG